MKYNYYGYSSGYGDKDEVLPTADQRKCIIHPNIDSTIANSILSTYDITKYTDVGIKPEMVLDAFKNFYNKEKQIVMKPSMYWFHYFLRKCDNHILSLATNNNIGYSYIASSAIIESLYNYLKKQDPDHIDEQNAQIQEGGESEGLDKAGKTAFNRAKKAIQDLQDTAANFGCSKSFGSNLEQAQILNDPKLLKQINVNASDLSRVINYIIDKAVNTVGGKRYTVEESIFESEDIEDIANVENFAHVALLNDLSVKENKYILNFDLFIDDSGSMGCKADLGGKRIELRTIARMVAFQMYASKLVKDIWIFACRGSLYKIPPEEIFNSRINGGTDLSQCFRQSAQTGRPCIILTDGNDCLDDDLKYNPKAYVVAISMTSLSESFIPYAENNQVLFYNNNKFMPGIVKNEYGNKKYVTC